MLYRISLAGLFAGRGVGKVTTDVLELKLSSRSIVGKKVKALRRKGIAPVHLYGGGAESLSLQIQTSALHQILPSAGYNRPINVEIEDQSSKSICFVRQVQRHPVTEEILHVDLLRVDVSKTIQAEVPIILEGEAPAVPNLGGTLLQPLSTVIVESLPLDMPSSFQVNVTMLDDFEKSVRIRDIQVGDNVAIIRNPEEMIARVAPPRLEEEPEIGEEEAELAEGDEDETAGDGIAESENENE